MDIDKEHELASAISEVVSLTAERQDLGKLALEYIRQRRFWSDDDKYNTWMGDLRKRLTKLELKITIAEQRLNRARAAVQEEEQWTNPQSKS